MATSMAELLLDLTGKPEAIQFARKKSQLRQRGSELSLGF